MNNTVKIIIFGFPKVKWPYLTGEVDKSVAFHVKISQDLTCQKSLKSVIFLTRVIKKIKNGRFGTRCIFVISTVACCL